MPQLHTFYLTITWIDMNEKWSITDQENNVLGSTFPSTLTTSVFWILKEIEHWHNLIIYPSLQPHSKKNRLVLGEHWLMTSPAPPYIKMIIFKQLYKPYKQLSASSYSFYFYISCAYILWFNFKYCYNLVIYFDIFIFKYQSLLY